MAGEFPEHGGRVIYLAAENSRRGPIDALEADFVPLYSTVLLSPEPPDGDVVVLASGSAARAYSSIGGAAPAISIGPETTRVAQSVGIEVIGEAITHDLDGLVAAVERCSTTSPS
jgi:uroporphyrinogen-III synthase